MSNKSNLDRLGPFEELPVRMPLWLVELKKLCSRSAEISAENEVDPQVADPIHEKGLD